MSTNLENDVMSGRRTWDKGYYEQKAARRAENEAEFGQDEISAEDKPRSDKEEFRSATKGTSGPMGSNRAFLSARSVKITADKEVGQVKVISAQQLEVGDGAGFFCEVCKCLLKDDRAYLNHVNGKNHQRALGFSMRVERAAVSSVKDKLKGLKRKKAGEEGDFEAEVESMGRTEVKDSELERKSAKEIVESELQIEEVQQKKMKREIEDEVVEELDEDAEMMRMMGFGGFK